MNALRTWAEVNLDALDHNLDVLRARVGGVGGTAILLVAKADAYGHGAAEIARQALLGGADAIAVATCAEACALRESGINGRLVALGPALAEEAELAGRHAVELVASSTDGLDVAERAARRLQSRIRVHLKVDTGMHRLGVPSAAAGALLARLRASRELELAGFLTHVAAGRGLRDPAGRRQIERFEGLVQGARARGLLQGRNVWVHFANSACVLSDAGPFHDAIRPGIAAYGLSPDPALSAGTLRPVLSVKTRVVQLQNISKGAAVGYGGTWRAPRPSRLAILPLGYADGIDRRLSDRGRVLLDGGSAPMVGRVSMDYTVVDVTHLDGVGVGDVVTIIGTMGERTIGVAEIAAGLGVLPYEVLCSVGQRVQRVYVGGTARAAQAAPSPDPPVKARLRPF